MRSVYDDRFYEFLCATLEGKSKPSQIILTALLSGGIVITGALCPNVLRAFTPLHANLRKRYKHTITTQKLNDSLYYLKKQKYIRVLYTKNNTKTILLTTKGKRYITQIHTKNIVIKKPKKWDKKWRVLIFDIPTEKDAARAALRQKIKELHFFQLQKSVWVYPYPCKKELLYIAHEHNVEEYVEVFTTQKFLHEKDVRKYFHL